VNQFSKVYNGHTLITLITINQDKKVHKVAVSPLPSPIPLKRRVSLLVCGECAERNQSSCQISTRSAQGFPNPR